MVKLNKELIAFIMQNLSLEGKDMAICEHLLNGNKFRGFEFDGKIVNSAIMSQKRDKYLKFINLKERPISIIEADAPNWLLESDLYKRLKGAQSQPIQESQTLFPNYISVEKHNAILQNEKQALVSKHVEELAKSEKKAIESATKQAEGLHKQEIEVLKEKHESTVNDLQLLYNQDLQRLLSEQLEKSKLEYKVLLGTEKEAWRLKFTKETAEIYERQIKQYTEIVQKHESEIASLKSKNDTLTQMVKDNVARLKQKDTDILQVNSKNSELSEIIAEMKAKIESLTPKFNREFVLQALVSVGWLLGLVALSVFSIENMIIYFNAGSFWIVAIILGVFIEFMLWATNIARFSGTLDDIDSVFESNNLSLAIFIFRAFANSLGGYYVSVNTDLFKESHSWYSGIVSTFTDINDLYFGLQLGTFGVVGTACIIGGMVAYMEYKALPLAIKHAYQLFIKRN